MEALRAVCTAEENGKEAAATLFHQLANNHAVVTDDNTERFRLVDALLRTLSREQPFHSGWDLEGPLRCFYSVAYHRRGKRALMEAGAIALIWRAGTIAKEHGWTKTMHHVMRAIKVLRYKNEEAEKDELFQAALHSLGSL